MTTDRWEQVEQALTHEFEVRAGMKPPPSIQRAFEALRSLRAEGERKDAALRELDDLFSRTPRGVGDDLVWLNWWRDVSDVLLRHRRVLNQEGEG